MSDLGDRHIDGVLDGLHGVEHGVAGSVLLPFCGLVAEGHSVASVLLEDSPITSDLCRRAT